MRTPIRNIIRRPRERERGSAILAAVVAISVILLISNQFGTNTESDLASAANQRDAMRASFLAKSATNIAELVVRLQQRIDNIEMAGGIQITDFADQLMLALCGTDEEVTAAIGVPPSQAKGMGATIGSCGVTRFDTEDDRINVNCAGGDEVTATTLKTRLDTLMYFPIYDKIFEEPDAEGWRRDRQMQASAIIDYIDRDRAAFGAPGTSEEYGYSELKDDYQPRNNYLDSVDELKLVRGVDDRFWSAFGSAFTIYGSCKSNVSAIKDTRLIASIIFLTAKNPEDPILQDQTRLWTLAGLVTTARQFGTQFKTLQAFVDFVKDPESAMLSAASGEGSGGSAAGGSTGSKLGVELDVGKLGLIAVAGARRTYRVEAWGEIPRAQKRADGSDVYPAIRRTVTGVWDTKVVTQNARNPEITNGSWVYLREN